MVDRVDRRRREPSPLRSKTAGVLLWFALLSCGTYLLARSVAPDDAGEQESVAALARSMLATPGQAKAAPLPAALAAGAGTSSPPEPEATTESPGSGEPARPALDDPEGERLRHFHEALARTAAGGDDAVTRIVHYGDSILTADGISGAARELLQKRFGDAGHGFVLPGRPWPWYMHRGVRFWGSKGWDIYRMSSNPLLDGGLGLGGVAFRSVRPGARFYVEPEAPLKVSKFELFYYAHPRGGRLRVSIDGEQVAELDSKADVAGSRFHEVRVPEGRPRLEVKNIGGGQVRVFGVSIERSGPGVLYDSLGINGLFASSFERIDGEHLAEQIRHRAPHLVVVMLGTNESQLTGLNPSDHRERYAKALGRIRQGAPDASCVVMSPPDRAARAPNGMEITRPIIPRIVEAQRAVADEAGCAFFNTFEAMGGTGSAARWRTRRPVLMGGDLTHPTDAGSEIIGRRLYEALLAGFEAG